MNTVIDDVREVFIALGQPEVLVVFWLGVAMVLTTIGALLIHDGLGVLVAGGWAFLIAVGNAKAAKPEMRGRTTTDPAGDRS